LAIALLAAGVGGGLAMIKFAEAQADDLGESSSSQRFARETETVGTTA
jgi:hypothetical protein